jgi:hypothetical protein
MCGRYTYRQRFYESYRNISVLNPARYLGNALNCLVCDILPNRPKQVRLGEFTVNVGQADHTQEKVST